MRTFSLAILLCAFWLVTSGRLDPLLLGFMGVACVLVVLTSVRLRVVDREGHPIHLVPRAVPFWGWLLVQVVKSNLAMLALLLQWRPALDPKILNVKITQTNDLGRAILANCVTLTPGTVTLEMHEDHMVVHALTASSAAELMEGEMDRRVRVVATGESAPGPGTDGPGDQAG